MLDRGFYYVGLFGCLILACAALALSEKKSESVAPSAGEAKPLPVGAELPDVEVKSKDGDVVKLREALAEKAAVIVFYRGHWCPACMKQLQGLDKIMPELKASGTTLIAIGTDKPEIVAETVKKTNFGFPLYSDSDLSVAKAMGLAYQLDAKSLETYGPTLLENTGHDSGQLPVPAVFIVDEAGKINFVHSNPDYKVRLSDEDLLAAVKRLHN
jgi:peroxiredoxin